MYSSGAKWHRQELYEKVWQFPLRKLAADYGISDVGLATVCRKLQIPLTGLGHWTKIQCGHTIPRPPLAEVKDLPVLMRQIREPKIQLLPGDSPELERLERIAAGTTPEVTEAMLAHPLIVRTKQSLSGAQTTDRGMLWGGREVDWLDVRVSKSSLARALRIMAVVLHVMERENFRLVVEKKDLESTSAMVHGETIRFGLVEKSRQVKPTADPKGSSSSRYSYNPIRLEPTGLLAIEVWSYYSGGLQKTWRDRDRARLEEQLPESIAGLIKIALAEKARRDAQEKKERERQKRIEEVTEELRKIEAEEKKVRVLRKEVIAWQRAKRIREYVAAVREGASTQADSGQQERILVWIEWAEVQADRIDPLKLTPHSILDDKNEVLQRLHSVRWG